MPVAIAKEPMNFCTCGIQIEPGEQIFPRSGGAIHVGCPERRANSENAVTESSGFLFGNAELLAIENTKDTLGVKHVSFDGATVLQIDTTRLATQLAKVFELMRDGKYRTLAQVASDAGCLETSASARLRDLRKRRFGSHEVVSRQLAGSPLVFEYRLIINEQKEIDGQRSAA
jgi:hypothetical protein